MEFDPNDLNDPEGRRAFVKRARRVAEQARAWAEGLEEIANHVARSDSNHYLALETIGEILMGAEDWPLVRGDVVLGWTKKHTPDNLRSLVTDLTNDEIDSIIASLQANPDRMKATLVKLAAQKRGA